jgi:aspartyl-tRNA(Asn)/glutamyl-tRNA(Gln) amidotransferase subunit A
VSIPSEPARLTIVQARAELRARRLSAVELTESVLARVTRCNDTLRAYLTVDGDRALAQARASDRRAESRALEGIPFCIKDVIDVAGQPTSAGAANWRREPEHDADAVARLRAAGAIVIGKGHTNEFAWGIDGQNPHWGDCANPRDPERLCGGSSSGPAVATAAGLALAGLGTDTAGSIRVPASLCGLVGVRPTPGVNSLDGIVPLAWSYDTVGPLTRTAADAEIVLSVLGHGPARPGLGARSGSPDPGSLIDLRVGVLDQLLDASESYVAEGVETAARHLESLGARVAPARLDLLRYANALHQIIQHAEAAAAHAPWFETQRAHYSDAVRVRLEAGSMLPAGAYLKAQRARSLLIAQAAEEMRETDVLLAPATPFVAPRRGVSDVAVRGSTHPLRPALLSCVLGPTDLACPIVSVPIGAFDELPFGMQLIGRPGEERLLLSIARACEPLGASGVRPAF